MQVSSQEGKNARYCDGYPYSISLNVVGFSNRKRILRLYDFKSQVTASRPLKNKA